MSCVFLRFIEDNELVDRPWISGTPQSGRLALARDRHDAYFRVHPHQNDRDYLIGCFQEGGTLPGLHTFFYEAHNPVFRLGVSGDAAMAVVQFWQEVAADSGVLIRDFTDPTWNTHFLGDIYQDLSESTRKRYVLLQTPEFVEEFILDRTLTPAIRELLRDLTTEQVKADPTSVSEVGIQLFRSCSVIDLPGYAEVRFYVEDEAGQLVPLLLDVQPGQRVLDACAAPGGKATHMAALMENQGEIVAVDRASARLDLVLANCRRLGVKILTPLAGDLRALIGPEIVSHPMLSRPFDRILLDAPRSGLVGLQRHPEGKWYKTTESIGSFPIPAPRAYSGQLADRIIVGETCSLCVNSRPNPLILRSRYLQVMGFKRARYGAQAAQAIAAFTS